MSFDFRWTLSIHVNHISTGLWVFTSIIF